MITVPRGKLQQNYNLVYDALETARLEESVNKLNENDGIMIVRIKTIKQFDNVVQDLRDIEGAVGKTLHIYDTPDNLPKFTREISDFCFYIFKYSNKTYINQLSMIDDDEAMPPLLSAMDFDEDA